MSEEAIWYVAESEVYFKTTLEAHDPPRTPFDVGDFSGFEFIGLGSEKISYLHKPLNRADFHAVCERLDTGRPLFTPRLSWRANFQPTSEGLPVSYPELLDYKQFAAKRECQYWVLKDPTIADHARPGFAFVIDCNDSLELSLDIARQWTESYNLRTCVAEHTNRHLYR